MIKKKVELIPRRCFFGKFSNDFCPSRIGFQAFFRIGWKWKRFVSGLLQNPPYGQVFSSGANSLQQDILQKHQDKTSQKEGGMECAQIGQQIGQTKQRHLFLGGPMGNFLSSEFLARV